MNRSEVIVATDGYPNIGLGKLDCNCDYGDTEAEREEKERAASFYKTLSRKAKESGTSISVIGIKEVKVTKSGEINHSSDTSCALDILKVTLAYMGIRVNNSAQRGLRSALKKVMEGLTSLIPWNLSVKSGLSHRTDVLRQMSRLQFSCTPRWNLSVSKQKVKERSILDSSSITLLCLQGGKSTAVVELGNVGEESDITFAYSLKGLYRDAILKKPTSSSARKSLVPGKVPFQVCFASFICNRVLFRYTKAEREAFRFSLNTQNQTAPSTCG